MKSEIKTIEYSNGEKQRLQRVLLDSWQELQFLKTEGSAGTFEEFCNIYSRFVIPKEPQLLGHMVIFTVPEDVEIPFPMDTKYGRVEDRNICAAIGFEGAVKRGRPITVEAKYLWKQLEERNCIRVISGKRNKTKLLPIRPDWGFLSKTDESASFKVNSAFFTMDFTDRDSPYDLYGTELGLKVKDGIICSPPLYGREALFVYKDGSEEIRVPSFDEITVCINGKRFNRDKNCRMFERPDMRRTPKGSCTELAIVNDTVVAVAKGGRMTIPSSGFVLSSNDVTAEPGDRVEYDGYEDVLFAIQVGNSVVIDGVPAEGFKSPFCNIKKFWEVRFPPGLYPLNFSADRAPRTAIGTDEKGRPMIVWAEGAAKVGYLPGIDSCGATLSEMGKICRELGMINGVGMDGGGSAQILLGNKRQLMISGRNTEDGAEIERPVPAGLMVK